jgi:hypothetical protein
MMIILKTVFYKILVTIFCRANLEKRKVIAFIYLLIVLSFFDNNVFSQTKNNLELFYSMVDSSSAAIVSTLPIDKENLSINLITDNSFFILKERLISSLVRNKINVSSDSGKNLIAVRYAIDNAKVNYEDISREGIFGSYFVKRNLTLSGSFVILSSKTFSNKFSFFYSDKIKLDSVKDIENGTFPFTHGELPSEPFFSSLIEPVIAVASAALTVILFFTVRSK